MHRLTCLKCANETADGTNFCRAHLDEMRRERVARRLSSNRSDSLLLPLALMLLLGLITYVALTWA